MKSQLPIASGVVHRVPTNLRAALTRHSHVLTKWNALTPLGRNEWICWITSPKKLDTREAHVVRAMEEIGNGKRRPCCWPGCPHRS